MTEEHVKLRLCIHDPRNPEYVKPEPGFTSNHCFCKHCQSGEDLLAHQALKWLAQLTEVKDKLDTLLKPLNR